VLVQSREEVELWTFLQLTSPLERLEKVAWECEAPVVVLATLELCTLNGVAYLGKCISVFFHSVLTFPIGSLAEFFHFPYNEAVPVSPSSTDLKAEGTVYIFDGSVAEIMNVTEVPGTGITGVCTKIQEVQYVGSQITLLGGGYCHFTYTLSMGITGAIDSFSAEGEVFDDLISSLSITGGTGSFALARGDLVIQPGYLDNATGIDFFTDAHLYFVNGTIFY
jgi:hypothetical protein